MIKEITTFIANASAGLIPAIPAFTHTWVIGTDLFAGHVPTKIESAVPLVMSPTPVRCVAVLENAGGATIPEWPDYVEKAVQIWNRNKNYFEARDDAMEIYNAIHGTGGWNLPVVVGPNWLVMVIDAVSVPAAIANPDEEGLYIFSCNYLWRIEQASC